MCWRCTRTRPTTPTRCRTGRTQSIVDAWDAINADPDKPLVSRAKDELFLPGSTGKLITASAALENGFGPESEWDNPQFLDLPQSSNTLANFGNSLCNGGSAQVTMAEAFKESCNVTFAEIGLKLGARNMSDQARAYGFCPTDPPDQIECIEPTIPFVLPFQIGHFPVPAYFQDNKPLLAFSSIGLDNVLTNPLHMALISAAIANGGKMMNPRLITEIRDPSGRVVRTFESEQYGIPIGPQSAAELRADDAVGDGVGHGLLGVLGIPDPRWRARPARPPTARMCRRTRGSRRSHLQG